MSAAVQHYDGVTIPERKLRKVFAYYYEGDEGHERKVRIEFSNGDAEHYKETKGTSAKCGSSFQMETWSTTRETEGMSALFGSSFPMDV